MIRIGINLQNLRELHGLTQKELAKKISKSAQAYSQYELNKRIPDLETLIALADFYKVSLDRLVGRRFDASAHHYQLSEFLKGQLSSESIEAIEKYISMIKLYELDDINKKK